MREEEGNKPSDIIFPALQPHRRSQQVPLHFVNFYHFDILWYPADFTMNMAKCENLSSYLPSHSVLCS
jgi:hypothetical protein